MDNRLLTFLEAIQTNDSMTKAAQSLFVSQPYMSRVIKKAETDYRSTLIDRHHQPVQLTYAGERLLSYLQRMQQLTQSLTTELTEINNTEITSMTLGITPPLANSWAAHILPAFYQRFPKIRTKILEISTSEAEKLLANEQLDFFIGKTIHQPGVESLPLKTIPLSLVIPSTARGYKAAAFWRPYDNQVLSQLTDEPFIRTVGEYRFQEMIDHFLADHGVHIEPLIEVNDSNSAINLALRGLGSIIVATDMLAELAAITPLPAINAFKLPISQLNLDFSVAYRSTTKLSEAIDFLTQQAQFDVDRSTLFYYQIPIVK